MTPDQSPDPTGWSPRVAGLADLLTLDEAVELLRPRPATVRKWCREGAVPGAVKIGPKQWRIHTPELLRYLGEQTTAGSPPESSSPPEPPE